MRSSAGNESWPSCRCDRLRRWLVSPTRTSPRSNVGFAPRRKRYFVRSPTPSTFLPTCSAANEPAAASAEVIEAIQSDPDLTASQRRSLIEAYEAFRQVTVKHRRGRGFDERGDSPSARCGR